ncbi:transmembrane and coiled-coil domain-containing protein 4-like [Tubulanus polymorphus]|uniref:transmembrane and coiled-coil domain-containing protein 4-like n=1 Tax=Tubulanus polymorphus TaxID=672921 RepID=UPI003DA36E78
MADSSDVHYEENQCPVDRNADSDQNGETASVAGSDTSELSDLSIDLRSALVLTDAGQYGYIALCAVCMHQLFNEPEHRPFNKDVIKKLIQHLQLPSQVEASAVAIMEGHGGHTSEPFVKSLMTESSLDKNPMLLVKDLIGFSLKDGCYDARMRFLIRHIAFLLHVNLDKVEDYEESVVEHLTEEDHTMSEEELKEKKKAESKRKRKRYFMIGLATIGGGTLIGLTGGLAAPLVAAGAGAIIGGAGAAALGTTAGIAIIGSIFGVAGAGLTGYKMKKRVGAIEHFEFMPIAESSQLHLTVAISGWLSKNEGDFALPWKRLANSKEQYCLKWESRYLLQMGQAIDYLFNCAVSMAAQEALKYTVLSGLLTAVAWPASLMMLAGVIDNPWSVCLERSIEAGKQLADVLLSRQQGKRPVTLIGFSLGARLIFSCLIEMAKRKGSEGIVEDVILLGAPITGDLKQWSLLSKVVSGRIVNGYCRGDWFLKFLYRTTNVQLNIAGLRPVKWDNRRMCNIDLSDVVIGHRDYPEKMTEILQIVGVRTKSPIERASPSLPHVASPVTATDEKLSVKNNLSDFRLERAEEAFECAANKTNDEVTDDSLEKNMVNRPNGNCSIETVVDSETAFENCRETSVETLKSGEADGELANVAISCLQLNCDDAQIDTHLNSISNSCDDENIHLKDVKAKSD